MDYAKALKEGVIRKSSNFICTISDDRGEELLYGNTPISEVFKKDIGIGGCPQHPLVQTSTATVRNQIHRNGDNGYG